VLIKVFLFNLMRLVDWPQEELAKSGYMYVKDRSLLYSKICWLLNFGKMKWERKEWVELHTIGHFSLETMKIHLNILLSLWFYRRNLAKKWNLNFKFQSRSDFQSFQLPKVENCKISCIWFSLCSQKYKRMIKDLYFIFLVDSQIWLNLHKDHHHISYIFLWMVATLATNKNS
jgi:hypothetical protein